MKDYTKRDQKKYGDMDIGKTAYPKFLENWRSVATKCLVTIIRNS